MKSKVTIKPAVEPVTLAELKASLRLTSTAEDALLVQYITDARVMVERYTSRKLITQTLEGYSSPYEEENDGVWWEGYRRGPITMLRGRLSFIELDNAPVQSVTVYTIDRDNQENVYDASSYYLDNYDEDRMPRIEFNDNATIPGSLRHRNEWKVEYVAGYGDSRTDVPADIRRAITVLAGYLWKNRGACGGDDGCVESCGAGHKLAQYRISVGLC